ncbi:hypothetical protein PGB90_010462 [Kerria lacca]
MVTVQFPNDLKFLFSYDLELICTRKKLVENKMNFVLSYTYSIIHFLKLLVTLVKMAHLPLDDCEINIIKETIDV